MGAVGAQRRSRPGRDGLCAEGRRIQARHDDARHAGAPTAGLQLHDGVIRASIAAATRAGDEPVPSTDLGEPEMEPGLAGWVMVHKEVAVAGAWSFLHEQDCGVYAVGTVPGWRRRGLARSLVEHVLADARGHGARTATLQSTRIAQQLYQSLGFEPAGRYEEWVSG